MSDYKLYKVYYEVPLLKALTNRFHQYVIPSEAVITSQADLLKFVPTYARAYSTDYYLYENKLVTYKELSHTPNFKGTGYYTDIYMLEYYEDHGDDGHTEYDLAGWILVTGKDLPVPNASYPFHAQWFNQIKFT